MHCISLSFPSFASPPGDAISENPCSYVDVLQGTRESRLRKKQDLRVLMLHYTFQPFEVSITLH